MKEYAISKLYYHKLIRIAGTSKEYPMIYFVRDKKNPSGYTKKIGGTS